MWIYSDTLGLIELQKRKNKYYIENTNMEVQNYSATKEEASIYAYLETVKRYNKEKSNLQQRIDSLDKLIEKAKKTHNIEILKDKFPEYFLN